MEKKLHFDCWEGIVAFLDEHDKCSVSAASRYLHQCVLKIRSRTLLLSLVDNDNNDDGDGDCAGGEVPKVPHFVDLLRAPEINWTRKWSCRVGFRPASTVLGADYVTENSGKDRVLDANGWDCQRPLHSLENTLIQLLGNHSKKEIKIIDRRPTFSYWDSMPLHHSVLDHMLQNCTALQTLYIEHLCLSSRLSFREPTEGDGAVATKNTCFPELTTLVLMDTDMGLDLMWQVAQLAPNLETLHVSKFNQDITEQDFKAWLVALPRLENIRAGYSFKHGRRCNREGTCTACENFHRRDAQSNALHHPKTEREFSICIRDNITVGVLDALLGAASAYSIRNLHVYGLKNGFDDMHNHEYNATALDRIFDQSISEASGESLRRLYLGPKVPLEARHVQSICSSCQGLEDLTLKTRLEAEGLQMICAQLLQLRSLAIYLNRPYNHGVNCAIQGDSFKHLPSLKHLEALQLLLYGDFYSNVWYDNEFGAEAYKGGISNSSLMALTECPALKDVQFGCTKAKDLVQCDKDGAGTLTINHPFFSFEASAAEEKAGIREFSFAEWVQEHRHDALVSVVAACDKRR